MKTSTSVYLFKGCLLTEEKNFIVDDLVNALTFNWSSIRISGSSGVAQFINVQYQKIKLNMSLKLVGDELYVQQFYHDTFNYAYMTQIIYDDNNIEVGNHTYYFFIKKCRWLSQKCIEVELKMDTLNTYHSNISVYINNKTHTLRRHKDRYLKRATSGDNITLEPIVDFYSEGINALKYREAERDITLNDSESGYNTNWYFVYKNNGELDSTSDLTKAVQCFLYSETETILASVSTPSTTSIYTIAYENYTTTEPDQSWWHCIYLTYEDNGPASFTFYHIDNNVRIVDGTLELGDVMIGGQIFDVYTIAIYWTDAGVLKIQTYSRNGVLIHEVTWPDATFFDSNNLVAYRRFVGLRSQFAFIPIILRDIDDKATYHPAGAGGRAQFRTIPFSIVNRSDATLIKIIKSPYCPVPLSSTYIKPNWRTGGLEILDTSQIMNRSVICNVSQSWHPVYRLKDIIVSNATLQANTTPRNMNYETKLNHSDYFTPKVVYDSFSFDFRLETQDADEINSNINFSQLKFDFTMTSTINSRFLMTFTWMTKSGNVYIDDYENVMPIIRNNEMTIFNQQYINYLRAGYNYDVKAKTITEAKAWIGVVGAGVGGATAGAMQGGPVGAIAGGVAGTLTGTINAIFTSIQAEESFTAKQNQLKLQATSVYGADDVDLMSQYTGNRAKLVHYNVSPKIKNLLYNLFYYYGYVSDEYGNPYSLGWTTTRNNFNFLQCEMVFNTQWADADIMEDVVNRYKAGATIFHKTTSGQDTNCYDFQQARENWEVAILQEAS